MQPTMLWEKYTARNPVARVKFEPLKNQVKFEPEPFKITRG